MNVKTKELINQLDPNKIQCQNCNKWINSKDSYSYWRDYRIPPIRVCFRCFANLSVKEINEKKKKKK